MNRFKSSLKLAGDKVQMVRHSVVPFTTIRNVNDFRPALLTDDVRIALLDPTTVSSISSSIEFDEIHFESLRLRHVKVEFVS